MYLFRRPPYSPTTCNRFSCRPTLERLEDRMQPSGFAGLGAAADFGVLALANTDVKANDVLVVGDVGLSPGDKLQTNKHSTITGNVVVNPTLIAQAGADALSASAEAKALTATQSFGTISKPTTVTGNGGLNVIAINGDLKASLILSGSANDIFIVNVTGSLKFSGNSTLGLAGGVTADHVLYNFTGAKGEISSKEGNVLNGTLLAPKYSFDLDGVVNGQIVGGGKDISLHHGAKVNAIGFHFTDSLPPPPPPALASLSGSVYSDMDGNGVRDPGEGVLVGVQITLTGVDAQGNSVTRTTFTGNDGSYNFTDLNAGTYQIAETQPGDYLDGAETVGTVNGSSQGQQLADDLIGEITLGAGQSGVGYDFGEFFFSNS